MASHCFGSLDWAWLLISPHQGKENYEVRKMRKYDGWNKMPYRERSLYTTFDSFNIKAANVGINSAIVDEANGIVASGGGGGTRTTHQTPTTITITPNADAKMRLNPIQRIRSVSR
jgi:hypothetical protein